MSITVTCSPIMVREKHTDANMCFDVVVVTRKYSTYNSVLLNMTLVV